METERPIVCVQDIHKYFGRAHVLAGISFDAAKMLLSGALTVSDPLWNLRSVTLMSAAITANSGPSTTSPPNESTTSYMRFAAEAHCETEPACLIVQGLDLGFILLRTAQEPATAKADPLGR